MKRCNLFALTSHYEGQSMVLLEALTVGTHALASDIPANRYVLKAGDYGMLTENTPELVEENIRKFINHATPTFEHFDAKQHNAEALEQLYSLLH